MREFQQHNQEGRPELQPPPSCQFPTWPQTLRQDLPFGPWSPFWLSSEGAGFPYCFLDMQLAICTTAAKWRVSCQGAATRSQGVVPDFLCLPVAPLSTQSRQEGFPAEPHLHPVAVVTEPPPSQKTLSNLSEMLTGDKMCVFVIFVSLPIRNSRPMLLKSWGLRDLGGVLRNHSGYSSSTSP